jgi:hypothetical protein
MGVDPTPLDESNNFGYKKEDRPRPKREFLKRKSKKTEVSVPVQPKKYNYYVDNFDGDKNKEEQPSN